MVNSTKRNAAFLAVAGIAMVIALHSVLLVGYDFAYWYWPIPRAWLAGTTALYDAASLQFFSPPWTVWLLLPFALSDIQWGMTALTVLSLAIVGFVAFSVAKEEHAARPVLIVAAAILCPYSLTALFVGTLDPWALAGIYSCYLALGRRQPVLFGIGLLLALTRPQQCWLTLPVLLMGLRNWPREMVAKSLVLPAIVFLVTLPFFGFDWPLRLVQSYASTPPFPYLITSTYNVARLSGVPVALFAAGTIALGAYVLWTVWREGVTVRTLGLAVAANAVVAPYMLSHSYVTVLAIAWAALAARRPRLALLLYVVSLPMLIRAGGLWDRVGLIDVCFPLLLVAVLLWERAKMPGRVPSPWRGEPA